jgi:hypothetical protein
MNLQKFFDELDELIVDLRKKGASIDDINVGHMVCNHNWDDREFKEIHQIEFDGDVILR